MSSRSYAYIPAAKTGIAYAGFWRRLLAYLIDLVVLSGIEFTLGAVVLFIAPGDLQSLRNVGPVSALIAWAYFVILESSPARGTLGKMALNLYVGDLRGDPITFRRAALRNFLKSISWLLLGLGFVAAAFTPRKQAVHDLLGGTLVLRKVRYFVIGPEAPTEPGEHWDGAGWVASVPPLEKS